MRPSNEEILQALKRLELYHKGITKDTPIKDCPFCGGKAEIGWCLSPYGQSIYCTNCFAQILPRRGWIVEQVIELWNSRV